MERIADPDICDISTLLHCVGFKMKSLETFKLNSSQDTGLARTIVLTCHASGTQIVMESYSNDCSCPPSHDDSSFYQVSGITRGVESSKETGSAYMDALPSNSVNYIKKEVAKMVELIRNGNNVDNSSRLEAGEGASVLGSLRNLAGTPPRQKLGYHKPETPTRYRSLDTLTAMAHREDPELPEPGKLTAKEQTSSEDLALGEQEDALLKRKKSFPRQKTYSLSEPDVCPTTRTSSPIKNTSNQAVNKLLEVQEIIKGVVEGLQNNKVEQGHGEPSNISLNLDVSKISLVKVLEPPKTSQYKSSPNLSNVASRQSAMKRGTSIPKQTRPKIEKVSMSPNFQLCSVRSLESPAYHLSAGPKSLDNRLNRVQSMRASPVTPPSLQLASSAKKKSSLYSHVKSTIPRPSFLTKKDEKKQEKVTKKDDKKQEKSGQKG